jgi:hypothetical protein
VQPNTNWRTTIIEQRKTLGLCQRCDEKYFSDHKCTPKLLNVMKVQEESREEMKPKDDKKNASKRGII